VRADNPKNAIRGFNHVVVEAQSPSRLLYSATLGMAAMILATPTGERR
jgi:hypothetical protein